MPSLWEGNYALERRDVPRIGGSEGGFIGLVVGLGVIIAGSCIAIYILLRDHSPSDRERESRRQNSTTRYPSESSAAPFTNTPPWVAKVGGIFGFHGVSSSDGKLKMGRGGGHGWIQASGDAWEADELERHQRDTSSLRAMSALASTGRFDEPFRPPTDPYFASYASETTLPDSETRYDPIMPSSHSNPVIGNPSPIIPRTSSPESVAHPEKESPTENPNRHFSIESTTSVRTFQGGTKFLEGL